MARHRPIRAHYRPRTNGNVQPGIPIDASGGPTVDPTRNVLDLVGAAITRVDDLMDAHYELMESWNRRQDDLRNMEMASLREMAALRAQHAKELSEKETQRLDAIRQVDVGAVGKASEVQAAAAATLATQVATSAETLRTTVNASAAAAANSLAQTVEPILAAVESLRQAQYQQQGQAAQRQESRAGSTSTNSFVAYLLFGAFGLLVGIGGLIVAIVKP